MDFFLEVAYIHFRDDWGQYGPQVFRDEVQFPKMLKIFFCKLISMLTFAGLQGAGQPGCGCPFKVMLTFSLRIDQRRKDDLKRKT